jgi:hypothetical protein
MLEGQVAVLSSGALTDTQAVSLLEALFESPLYREDQKTFMLYPRRDMPGFLERGVIPEDLARSTPAIRKLETAGDLSIIQRDPVGVVRFAGALANRKALDKAIKALSGITLTAEEAASLRDVYEQVFQHRSYTGRSGSMFAYEGNGCIYWHMVAKLLLAAQEAAPHANTAEKRTSLSEHYRRIRAGLGFNKTAAEYGAFPLDAYSHSAWSTGARQPGMTGQVKEEVITRRRELGVVADHGVYRFDPASIHASEWLTATDQLTFFDVHGHQQTLDLNPGELALTVCQTPVVYRRTGGNAGIIAYLQDGGTESVPGLELTRDLSASIMRRDGRVTRLIIEC